MDFSELVRTRRTVNNYLPDELPISDVEEALALSLWAPNHKLTFPWVYTWVGPRARKELSQLAVELKSAKGELSETKAKAVRDTMLNPAHLIALAIKRSHPFQEHEDYATLSCSVQIATMHLWQKKIGTKWSTGGAWLHEKTYGILGLDPAKVKLEGGLLIGVPQQIPSASVRPPLGDFLKRTT